MRRSHSNFLLLAFVIGAAAPGCAPSATRGDWVAQFAAVVGDPTGRQAAARAPAAEQPPEATPVAARSRAAPVLVDEQVAPASLLIADEPATSCDSCADPCTGGCCNEAGLPAPPCPLGEGCVACRNCLAGRRCPILDHKILKRPQPGPPPVSYVPPMPPKFLPVPTRPTLSPARPDAPDAWRGDVEVGFRRELTIPGRD